MKKYTTVLLITFLIANQPLKAQLDMAFISNFSASTGNSVNRLTWTIMSNQAANSFNVERSTNGNDFKTVGIVMATEKFSTESYTYSDTIKNAGNVMYRLRIFTKTQHTFYSRIILVRSKMISTDNIAILGNPAMDKLIFNYNSTTGMQADIKIYNLYGDVILNQKISYTKGNNLLTIPLNSLFSPGLYVMEINDGIFIRTEKFIKQ
jgi:hypothetical protein